MLSAPPWKEYPLASPLFTILTAAGLAASAVAQQQTPVPSLQPVSNLQYGAYDFEHGFTVTSGANRAIGPDILFSTLSGPAYYYGAIGGNSEKQEWLDEAQLPNRGLSGEEFVNGMAWMYCEGGYTSYFDAYVSLYTDTVACAGPSAWIPASPSFADCIYGVNQLPGSGCWFVTVDLSEGYECTLPDAANPQSGTQGTIGWSVTPFNCNSSPFLGPFLHAGVPPPGSQPTFEWRDWNGLYFGAYTHGGCYSFGVGRGDFKVAFYGAPADVQYCYGANPLDTLNLRADDAVENGTTWNYTVSNVRSAARFFLLVQPDGSGTDVCDQATTAGNGGSFTRQVSLGNLRTFVLGTRSQDFSGSLAIPPAPVNIHALFQVIRVPLTGPVNPANVDAASNGIDTTL